VAAPNEAFLGPEQAAVDHVTRTRSSIRNATCLGVSFRLTSDRLEVATL
jgi:hypothetical protein